MNPIMILRLSFLDLVIACKFFNIFRFAGAHILGCGRLTLSLSYMKPGTPHFVYGLEDAICVGSHHYVTTLMQETLQGLIHAFVLHKFLTNTQHPPTRQILRKILIFFQRGTMLGQIPPDGEADSSFLLY